MSTGHLNLNVFKFRCRYTCVVVCIRSNSVFISVLQAKWKICVRHWFAVVNLLSEYAQEFLKVYYGTFSLCAGNPSGLRRTPFRCQYRFESFYAFFVDCSINVLKLLFQLFQTFISLRIFFYNYRSLTVTLEFVYFRFFKFLFWNIKDQLLCFKLGVTSPNDLADHFKNVL